MTVLNETGDILLTFCPSGKCRVGRKGNVNRNCSQNKGMDFVVSFCQSCFLLVYNVKKGIRISALGFRLNDYDSYLVPMVILLVDLSQMNLVKWSSSP